MTTKALAKSAWDEDHSVNYYLVPHRLVKHDGWRDGIVETAHGIVSVYADKEFTCLTLIRGGRRHTRSWSRHMNDRSITIQARRWAREVANGG